MIDATTKYKEDSDTVGQWLEQKITKTPTASIKSSDAYKSYKDWTEVNGYYHVSAKTFKSSLEERGFILSKQKDANYYLGMMLSFRI